jgi:hypothetical protein
MMLMQLMAPDSNLDQSTNRELVVRRETSYKTSPYIMARTVSYVRVAEGSNTEATSRRIHQIRPAASKINRAERETWHNQN